MAGDQRNDHAKTRLPGHKRLQIICAIAASDKYSRLAVRVAGLLAYQWSDKTNGETFVGLSTICARVKAGKRVVQQIISDFEDDGFLTKVGSHAPGRPSVWRLTLPAPLAEAMAQPTPPDWNDYTLALQKRINRAKDDAAVQQLWESPAETKQRNAMCSGENEWRAAVLDGMLEARLRDGECSEIVPF
jgi:hypothetical protein